jgi:hypothetical protein
MFHRERVRGKIKPVGFALRQPPPIETRRGRGSQRVEGSPRAAGRDGRNIEGHHQMASCLKVEPNSLLAGARLYFPSVAAWPRRRCDRMKRRAGMLRCHASLLANGVWRKLPRKPSVEGGDSLIHNGPGHHEQSAGRPRRAITRLLARPPARSLLPQTAGQGASGTPGPRRAAKGKLSQRMAGSSFRCDQSDSRTRRAR